MSAETGPSAVIVTLSGVSDPRVKDAAATVAYAGFSVTVLSAEGTIAWESVGKIKSRHVRVEHIFAETPLPGGPASPPEEDRQASSGVDPTEVAPGLRMVEPSFRDRSRWRKQLPEIGDLDLAFGRAIDELRPDLVYVMDALLLPAGCAAKVRGRSWNKATRLVYAPQAPASVEPDLKRAQALVAMERAHASHIDLVMTRTEEARAIVMREMPKLRAECEVVPDAALPITAGVVAERYSLRERCSPEAKHVIAAVVTPTVDPDVVIDALAAVPNADCVLVPTADLQLNLAKLVKGAPKETRARLGVSPVLDSDLLAPAFRDVDVVVALDGGPRARVAVATAVTAALESRVPVVVARGIAAADAVRASGAGYTVTASDPDSVASGIRRALLWGNGGTSADWRDLVEGTAARLRQLTGNPEPPPRVRLAIGPRNGNGMAWAWTRAMRERRPEFLSEVFGVEFDTGKLAMRLPADHEITLAAWKSPEWQLNWTRHVLSSYTHVLLEQGLTAFGWLNGKFFWGDVPVLRASGVEVGLIVRGSEARNPEAHAARQRFSPFADPQDRLTVKLQRYTDNLLPKVRDFDGQVFVTTLDLIDDIPQATWLPHVLDLDLWSPGRPAFSRRVPTVLHAPSREQMKGSSWVDDACIALADAGRIRYERLRGVPFDEMRARIRDADIVIDQMALGSYGVLALQAMASGRVVVGHVAPEIRGRLPVDLPIIEAPPDQLRRVLEEVLDAHASMGNQAEAGRAYVKNFHSGEFSARLLEAFVEGRSPAEASRVQMREVASRYVGSGLGTGRPNGGSGGGDDTAAAATASRQE